MNEMVKRHWTAMDGCLVFDFTINRDPSDGIPSCATVSCKSGPSNSQLITIATQRPARPFEHKFPSGCYVSVYLSQQTPVHINGVTHTAIFADMHYGMRGQNDDHHFEGIMVACPTRGPLPPPTPPWPPHPTPIEPDPPVDPVEPLPVITSHPEELFPYVYVRGWPKITAEDLQYGFVQYCSSSPPSCSFYDDLVAARKISRDAAQDLAVQFIDGCPPYYGDFIGAMDTLAGPVAQFAQVLSELPKPEGEAYNWLAGAAARITQLLNGYALNWDYFASGEYAQALDRVWQSYFALVVTLGYDTALLDQLTRTLILAHLIAQAWPAGAIPAAPDGASAPIPEQPSCDISMAQIAALLRASGLLPCHVFPLPASPVVSDYPAPCRGWIEPYAIGDLQLVRQRLLRYQSGEIARIENVMRGERREVTHKRTHRQFDEQKQTTTEMQILQNDAADERSNLQEESRKTVAEATETNTYNNFTSSYGPPTQATLDGSWSKAVTQGSNPGVDDTTRFARDILNKTVNRITRSVSQTRASSTMSQTEDCVVSMVDNTNGAHSMRAVFRWLNKVYEACVVNYGQRLMMECMVYRPAASFIAQEHALGGQDFVKPLSPLHWHVATFEGIQSDNYAQLGAYYGVLDLEPPPLAQRSTSASLRAGEEKQIAIPAGYCASDAYVSFAITPNGLPAPVVLVGRQSVNLGATSTTVALHGEDDSVPVSVMDYPPSLSPPSDPQIVVNVEVVCVPSQRCMDQWRIRIYASILRAYQERLTAYYARADGGAQTRAATRSPLANRQIEQRELKNACLRLLLERLVALTGAATDGPCSSSPPAYSVNEPRYLQFFDEVLEWNEMVYSFYASPGVGPVHSVAELGSLAADDDAVFASFLQADQARVLLPVRPAHVLAFLYFYSSGMLWAGPDWLAPVNPADLALVNDLKHADPARHPPRRIGACWEVVVPTAMQVLDETGADGGPCVFMVGSPAT